MPGCKLAVAVYHGIAAVSLLFSATVILRSGWTFPSDSHPENSTIAARGATAVPDAAPPKAAKIADPDNPAQRELLAEAFVHQKLALWQQRMNMDDWKIKVELTRASDLEPNTLGNSNWDLDAKEATIHVMSPYDYKLPFQAMLDDMDVTVVHELVHIQLAALPRTQASRGKEEHAVVELTSALMNLAK